MSDRLDDAFLDLQQRLGGKAPDRKKVTEEYLTFMGEEKSKDAEMGREVLPDGTVELTFKVTPAMKDAITELAKYDGITESDVIQRAVFETEKMRAARWAVLEEEASRAAATGLTFEEWVAKRIREKEPATAKPPAAPAIPLPPNPFDGQHGEAHATNNPHSAHATRAIIAAGKDEARKVKRWEGSTLNDNPQYREALPSWGGGAMTTYFDPGKYNAPELWGKVRAMDTITLDVMLVVMALICDPRNKAKAPNLGWVTLHPEQVMNLKAFQRRGHDKRVMAQRTLEAMKTLSELSTDIVRVPYKWNRKRTKVIDWVTERGCKIFHIGSVAYREQGELFEHPDEYPEDKEVVAIHIFAGRWAHYWLNEVKDGQHYDWLSVASQALLQLGENRVEQAAKRFGVLLLTMPGATGPFLRTQEDTHAGVLEAIGELCKDEYRGKVTGGDRKGQDWGRRMEKRLYGGEDDNGTYRPGVFDVLVEIGLLESYEKPVDALTDEANRRRGWVDDWLALKVRWTTSVAAANIQAAELKNAKKEATQKLAGKGKPRRRNRGTGKTKKTLARAQYLDGDTITALYVAYRERNWIQATLAHELKCARSTLSNILNRREAPSAELAARIRAFLDSPIDA